MAAPGCHRQVREQGLRLARQRGSGIGGETETSEEHEGESGCHSHLLRGARCARGRGADGSPSPLDEVFTFPRVCP
jgi:hypothetical protein